MTPPWDPHAVHLRVWNRLTHLRWHQYGRALAFVLLLDQGKTHVLVFPPEITSAVVLALIAALFAPVSTEREP